MIGYYVHHHGSGHLHRALSVAPQLPDEVTGLSSLPRPANWTGPWIQLPRDDQAAGYGPTDDVSANGRLHWAPLTDPGLRDRTAALAAWIGREAPTAFLVDQSVEVCLLARLHGVPVIGLTAPGRRTDEAHRLGFDSCSALVGAWPTGWTTRMLPNLDARISDRFEAVGAVSRFPVTKRQGTSTRRPRAVLLAGTGGDGFSAEVLDRAKEQTPDWDWTVLSRSLGTWYRDPFAMLADADVAVLHPGQNSLAEVASLRIPALVVPAPRPFEEQHVTASVLTDGWPAVVADTVPRTGWRDLLHAARALDGDGWAAWCDGHASTRIAAVVRRVAGEQREA